MKHPEDSVENKTKIKNSDTDTLNRYKSEIERTTIQSYIKGEISEITEDVILSALIGAEDQMKMYPITDPGRIWFERDIRLINILIEVRGELRKRGVVFN